MPTQPAGIQNLSLTPDGLSLRQAQRPQGNGGLEFVAGPVDEITGTVQVQYIDILKQPRSVTARVFRAQNGALVVNLDLGEAEKHRTVRQTVFLQ